jgi:uncharacterized protein YndB with AHSA1/START domain
MSCAKEIVLPLDRDEAWAAVTEEEALEAWLAERVELDLRPGGDASFVLADGERRGGMVEEVAVGERLTFWWWPREAEGESSRVTFELAPAAGGTRVRVTETPAGPTASVAPTARALAYA